MKPVGKDHVGNAALLVEPARGGARRAQGCHLLDLRAEERPDRAAWDRFLERVAQVSAGLLAGGFAHEVIWYQPEGAGRCAMGVSNERELQWMLCPLVGASTYKGDEIGEEEQDTTEQDRAVIRIGLTGEARRTGGAER